MKVSVLLISYNHEKFIAQALDSVLMQEVDFDYEIVVGEDCSTDQTRKIVEKYQQKHPNKIQVLLPEKNLGMLRNFVKTFKACRGQYIALLEGDDYWTSRNKLQKQVNFLDTHSECTECFHNVNVIYDSCPGKNHPFHRLKLKKYFTLKDVVSRHFIPTCSTMFRNGLFKDFPDWFYTLPMGDWPLHVMNAEHGSIGYINDILGTYRVHGGGLWSSTRRIPILMHTIEAAETIDRYLHHRYHINLNNLIARCHYEIAQILLQHKDYERAAFHGGQALMRSQSYNIMTKAGALKIILGSRLLSLFSSAA